MGDPEELRFSMHGHREGEPVSLGELLSPSVEGNPKQGEMGPPGRTWGQWHDEEGILPLNCWAQHGAVWGRHQEK